MNKAQGFSNAPIWDLQKKYYQNLGIETWGKALVPFNATSNAFIAHHYAQVIRAYIVDIYYKYQSTAVFPINILELGVGHGRFSFMLLQALEKALQDLDFAEEMNLYRYIMTDVAESNIQVWINHPRLAKFIQEDKLDFAFFDVQQPEESYLIRAKQPCSELLKNRPQVIVANFILDVLPYDLFFVRAGELEACQVSYQFPPGITLDKNPEAAINDLAFKYQRHKISLPFYDNNILDSILEEHALHLKNTVFQFPLVSIEIYRYFASLTEDNLWLISEEADTCWEQLEGKKDVGLKKAGSFTSRVNLQALFMFAGHWGAMCCSPKWPDARFDSYAVVRGFQKGDHKNTQVACNNYLFDFGPKDYFRLLVSIYKNSLELDANGCISLLELGYCDSYQVFRLRKMLLHVCKQASAYHRFALEQALTQSWENYYDLGEDFDYAFTLGTMLFYLKSYRHALAFFKQSLVLRGEASVTYYQMGKCAQLLKDVASASQFYQQALVIQPDYVRAQQRLKLLLE